MQENINNAISLKRTQARNLFLAREFTNAEKLLKEILAEENKLSEKDFFESKKLLATLYLRSKRLDESLKIWLELEKLFPDNLEVLNNLGIAYRNLKDYTKSKEVLEKAQALGGKNEDILFNLGSTYKDAGEYDKAIDCFQKLVKLKPDDALAYNYLGTAYLSSGDESKAAFYYKKGLLVDPNHPYLNFNLANIYKKDKAFTEALVFYNIALKVNPNWSDVLHSIAEIYTEEGNVNEAINYEKAIIRTEGESEKSCVTLGKAYLKLNDENQAVKYFQRALQLNPTSEEGSIAYANYLLAKKDIRTALQILSNARKGGSESEALLLLYANTCLNVKDFATAKEIVQDLYKKNKNSIEVLKIYGKLFSLLGQQKNAEKIFLQILRLYPSEIALRLELAQQYYENADYTHAVQQLEKYLIEKPSDVDARVLLGQCYEKQGEIQRAQQELKRVLDDNPKNISAMATMSKFLREYGNVIDAVSLADNMINVQSERGSQEDLTALAESLKLYEQATEKYSSQKSQTPAFLKIKNPQIKTTAASANPVEEHEDSFELPTEETTVSQDLNLPFDDMMEMSGEEETWSLDAPIDETTLDDLIDVDSPLDIKEDDENISGPSIIPSRDAAFEHPINYAESPAQTSSPIPKDIFGNEDFVLPEVQEEPDFEPNTAQQNHASACEQQRQTDQPLSRPTDEYTLPDTEKSTDEKKAEEEKLLENLNEGLEKLENAQNLFDKQSGLLDRLNDAFNNHELPSYDDDKKSKHDDILSKQNDLIDKLTKSLEDLNLPEYGTENETLAKQNDLLDALNDKLNALDLPQYSDAEDNTEKQLEENTEAIQDLDEQPQNYDKPLSVGQGLDNTSEHQQTLEQTMADDGIDIEGVNKNLDEVISQIKKVPVGKIKQGNYFDNALRTISSSEMLNLFKCLRDMMSILPENESKEFLVSNERLQMQYIINKLTGTVGLRMRAIFMKMRNFLEYTNTSLLDSNVTVKNLLAYLKSMAEHLPDQGFSEACVTKLDNIIETME